LTHWYYGDILRVHTGTAKERQGQNSHLKTSRIRINFRILRTEENRVQQERLTATENTNTHTKNRNYAFRIDGISEP
jgi:hypothetical protein